MAKASTARSAGSGTSKSPRKSGRAASSSAGAASGGSGKGKVAYDEKAIQTLDALSRCNVELAAIDPLTQVLNRRQFATLGEVALANASRRSQPVGSIVTVRPSTVSGAPIAASSRSV